MPPPGFTFAGEEPAAEPRLEQAAADYERQVGLAVQSDPDVQAFVERLEQIARDEREDETE